MAGVPWKLAASRSSAEGRDPKTGRIVLFLNGISQVVFMVKNPPANVGDARDTGLIPG